MESVKFAVTHASSLLAESLLEKMADLDISPDSVILLDLEKQVGNRLAYGDTYISVLDQYEFDYEDLTAVLLLEPDAELESLLKHADCYVISHHADDDHHELFIPQLSPHSNLPEQPCSLKLPSAELSSLLFVIKLVQQNFGLSTLHVVNVLSSSFFGKPGVEELASQTMSLLNSQDVKSSVFPQQLAFNMIPEGASSFTEDQLVDTLQADALKCSVQHILVPAFHGLAISVSLEAENAIDVKKLEKLFNDQPGIQLLNQTISPFTHCKESADVLINCLHQPQKDVNRLQFWIIADSVRNGLIQNYLNVLEILLKSFL